jgi:hypothetical protein
VENLHRFCIDFWNRESDTRQPLNEGTASVRPQQKPPIAVDTYDGQLADAGGPGETDGMSEWRDLDRVGTFTYVAGPERFSWSPAAAVVLGFGDQQPSIDLLMRHAHSDDHPALAECVQSVVQGKPFRTHYRLVNKSADVRWIVLVGHPVTDAAGSITGTFGLVIDVTDTVQSGVTATLSEVARSRGPIEQAKGVLMAAYGITADEAFARLVRRSQDTNIKLREVAGQFLDAVVGGLPDKVRAPIERIFITVGN